MLRYLHLNFLDRFQYLGFWQRQPSEVEFFVSLLLALLPIAVLATEVDDFADYIHWMLYFFVYVPSMVVPSLQGRPQGTMLLSGSLALSFLFIVLFPRIRLARPLPALSPRLFWVTFVLGYLALAVYAIRVFGESFALVSLWDVYEQRAVAGEAAEGTLAGYATGILAGCMNPFLMAYGLIRRRKLLVLWGALGQLFVFTTFALKSVVISVPLLLGFYWLLLTPAKVPVWRLGVIVVLSIAGPLALMFAFDADSDIFIANIAALVFLRTYGLAGATIGVYYDFFQHNPHTFYSHVGPVRALIDYPYDRQLGEVIGIYLGSPGLDYNANMFATDGIAAGGLVALIVLGLVAGLVIRLCSALVPKRNWKLICAASAMSIMNLANTSLFTSLLTGGLLFLILTCALAPLREPAS